MATRWKPDAAGRLEAAALELFGKHGYDRTTVAQIAARAGLTERTYFRHFADKREVLFYGQDRLQGFLADFIAQTPDVKRPADTAIASLEAAAAHFNAEPQKARERGAIIAAHPDLREREQHKLTDTAATIARALQQRGVKPKTARLAGELTALIFKLAYERWIAAKSRTSFPAQVRAAYEDLRVVAAGAS